MANDFIDRLQHVLYALIGSCTPDGRIIDMDDFNDAIEELAYIVNKIESEVW